jgi:Cytosine/adenosine deaminases
MQDLLFHRIADVIEFDVVPLTRKAVEIGSRVFGAAILRKNDLSLVLSATNHAVFSPLWHGEIYAIKQFFELQGHPEPGECLFIATHQPCCMCASALAWSGFREIYYLFDYTQTGKDFNMPDDRKMVLELFGASEPRPANDYFEWHCIKDVVPLLDDPAAAQQRISRLSAVYAELSAVCRAVEKQRRSM